MLRCPSCQTPVHPADAQTLVFLSDGSWSAYHAARFECGAEAEDAYLADRDAEIRYISARIRSEESRG